MTMILERYSTEIPDLETQRADADANFQLVADSTSPAAKKAFLEIKKRRYERIRLALGLLKTELEKLRVELTPKLFSYGLTIEAVNLKPGILLRAGEIANTSPFNARLLYWEAVKFFLTEAEISKSKWPGRESLN